jgi:phosphatidylserine/phosphatidylglycerophosphate/cardiolipin synthase-like enzyme
LPAQAKVSSPPLARRVSLKLLRGLDHYEELIVRELPSSKVALWIGTANLKELRIEAPIGTRARARGRYMSVLEIFESLAARGVDLRILHGRIPSRAFRQELAARPELVKALKLRECPRVHLKTIIIDGRLLYLGSANFTGAGLGARAAGRRNFELGVVSDDDHLLDAVQADFDAIWSGRECGACQLRKLCPKPIDTLRTQPAVTQPGASRPASRRNSRHCHEPASKSRQVLPRSG